MQDVQLGFLLSSELEGRPERVARERRAVRGGEDPPHAAGCSSPAGGFTIATGHGEWRAH